MENWLIEAFKIILSAIVGVLLAEAFPAIKRFFKRGSLSIRDRRVKYIKEEYKIYKVYKENHATLAVELIRQLTSGLGYLAFVILFSNHNNSSPSSSLIASVGGVFLGITLSIFSNILRLIDTIANFDRYKEKAIKGLKKLHATLEDDNPATKRSKK